jgi:hypothetical protein
MEPTLLNKPMQLSSEVKYLGLMLDKGLTWRKQLDSINNMAYVYMAFSTCREMSGRSCELRPKVVNWIYSVVVRPTVTYAATVWWHRIIFRTSRAELSKLQGWHAWVLLEQ